MMLTRSTNQFSEALSDDRAWALLMEGGRSVVTEAAEWLNDELADLRAQRVQKTVSLGHKEYAEFLARQAGCKRLLLKRHTEVVQYLASTNHNLVPGLRRRNKALVHLVQQLATVIDDFLDERVDDDALDKALHELRLPVFPGKDGDGPTLIDALDTLPNFRTALP